MNIKEIIAKKRDKKELTKQEIEFFITEYVKDNVTDYQAAALIMAIYLNGMNYNELTNLTKSMSSSGDILDLSKLGSNVVDKHSTGGVGDKISLILLPVIASLGIPVAKMSGRGLGFTGGTVDKLEAIPGYNTSVSIEKFISNVQKIGISLIGQSLKLAPADKKIYALRDTISCVDNIPLIASSIMSKKIASGANKLVLEVTVGSGAFMKTQDDAEKLANTMMQIGDLANIQTVCVLTNMNEPIGYSVGNTLEVLETIECLKGNLSPDILEIVTTIGAYMIKLYEKNDNIEENKKMILKNINNGKAYSKFLELVKNQEGDISYIENINKFKKAKFVFSVESIENGYVESLDAEKIGIISMNLGAGRIKKEDNIEYEVGIKLNKKIGSKVEIGDILAYVYANNEEKAKIAIKEIIETYKISQNEVKLPKHIIKILE